MALKRFRLLPESAVYWTFNDNSLGGAAGFIPSNKGTDATRIAKYATDANVSRLFAAGKYKYCAECRQLAPAGQGWWGYLSDPSAAALNIDGCERFTIGFWGTPHRLTYTRGHLRISQAEIRYRTDLGQKAQANAIPDRGAVPHDYLLRFWISGGMANFETWEDGVRWGFWFNNQAGNSFQRDEALSRLCGDEDIEPADPALMEDFYIVPDWNPTDDEIRALHAAPTVEDRAIFPCGTRRAGGP